MMVRQVIALTEKRREDLIDVSAFASWFRDISRSMWREHNANLRVGGNSHVAASPQLTPRVLASTPRAQDAPGGLGSGRLRACVHTYLTIFEPASGVVMSLHIPRFGIHRQFLIACVHS